MYTITLYKLSTGEEIIAKQLKECEKFVTLSDVRTLSIQPTSQGQFGVALVPWLAGLPEGEVEIEKVHIVGRTKTTIPAQLEKAYISQTSKIQLS